jgi:O-antigen ligase
MASKTNPPETQFQTWGPRVFASLFGAFVGLTLLKFSTPPVFSGSPMMAELLAPPTSGWEWLLAPWPSEIGYWLVGGLALLGVAVARWQTDAPRWLIALPIAWLLWQCIAATQTVDAALSRATLKHFAAGAVCFYLGLFCLNRNKLAAFFLWPIATAFVAMLGMGLNQHFGGLEQTRLYFYTYVYPTMKTVPPDYLKRIASDRISSTLFYPNTLAGAILLLLPPILAWICQAREQFTVGARALLGGLVGAGAMGCLYWSGSKGGWLLALLAGLIALLQLKFSKRIKVILFGVVLAAGLTGFAWKYAGFLQRGATSVVARFDYWRAAWDTAVARPVFGTGPGTFSVAYAKVKRPESEMARLTHNDYLQQASDSGFPGLLIYSAFIIGALSMGYSGLGGGASGLRFGVWLGLFAWAIQALGEFTLYVPSVAWPAFAFSGWLLGTTGKRIDKSTTAD